MNEVTLQWIQLIKLLFICAFATLYGFGGVRGKWKRRFIAPFILTAAVVGISLFLNTFHWWFIAYFPLLSFALHLGYGADTTGEKIQKRFLAGLALGVSAAAIAIPTGAWLLWGLHIFLCLAASIVLGVWNPTKSARAEETTIAFIAGLLPIMGMI